MLMWLLQVRKIRERKKVLKADDLLAEAPAANGNTEEWLRDLGTRRPQVNIKPDPDNFDIDGYDTLSRPITQQVKEELMDDPMDVDDLPGEYHWYLGVLHYWIECLDLVNREG